MTVSYNRVLRVFENHDCLFLALKFWAYYKPKLEDFLSLTTIENFPNVFAFFSIEILDILHLKIMTTLKFDGNRFIVL